MPHDPCPDDEQPLLHFDALVAARDDAGDGPARAGADGSGTRPENVPSDASGPPPRWIAFLHGIYGAGRNWNSVARRVVGARPEWGATMVDLRGHGDSTGFPPPHTVRAAACDLLRTARAAGGTPDAVLGHSFGGKVAMEYLRVTAKADADGSLAPSALWIVDSTPEAREPSGSAWEMFDVLRAHPGPFASRGAGLQALESEGVATPVARWLATNLVEENGTSDGRADDADDADEARSKPAWRWRIDVEVMEALLRDFFDLDLWKVVEDPPAGAHVHVVKATESSVLSGESLERVEAAASSSDRVHLHRVEGGHWLNADNPDALVELLAREL